MEEDAGGDAVHVTCADSTPRTAFLGGSRLPSATGVSGLATANSLTAEVFRNRTLSSLESGKIKLDELLRRTLKL